MIGNEVQDVFFEVIDKSIGGSMKPGFSIQARKQSVSDALLKQFKKEAVSNLSDVMQRTRGTINLRPMHTKGGLVGRALTVKTLPGDNLMVHKAIDLAKPGDVIVVDAGGQGHNAIIGEIMASLAARRKVAGFVIDGPVRDVDALRRNLLPVYANGISPRGPTKAGPGQINVPVVIDGMVVHPGDVIVADMDGVIAIELAQAQEVLALVKAHRDQESVILAQIAKGKLDRRWVDEAIAAKGIGTKPA